VYEQTKGLDGYVSLEINPKLGNEFDTQLKKVSVYGKSSIVLM